MQRVLICISTAILVCVGLVYSVFEWNDGFKKSPTQHSMNVFLSSRKLCHSRDGSTFAQNQLRQLHVENIFNQSAYRSEVDARNVSYISNNYSTLDEFIENTRLALMARRLSPGSHSLLTIFRNPPHRDMIKPSCDGLWMEFGVYRGGTLAKIADWKTVFCGNASAPVYGFDTFTGLPTNWRPGFDRGLFNIPNGTNISVPYNVVLVKGLFIDTLPTQLRLIDREYRCKTPVSFVHIDCDIYDGTRDVLFLLGSRFVTGTVIVFDELFNYPTYEKHEIKALFEYLVGSNVKLIPLGTSDDIEPKPTADKVVQSFAFVVDAGDT